jgi:rhodanese-related sulfurtransferase
MYIMFKMKIMALSSALVLSLAITPSLQADVAGIKGGAVLQAEVAKHVKDINTAQLKTLLADDPDVALVDIRLPSEIQAMGGAIKAQQNVNIPRGWLEWRITNVALKKDTPIVVYCGANVRSPLAADTLLKMGYTNVKNYADGYIGWKRAGLPIAK